MARKRRTRVLVEKLEKLVCQYSGLAQVPVFTAQSGTGSAGWILAGGFDPSLPFLSIEEAERAFRRRRGEENAVERASCPYTGKPVNFDYRHGMWYPVGDFFNPYAGFISREELIYRASFRAGIAGLPPPGRVEVQSVEPLEQASDPTEGLASADQAAIKEKVEEVFSHG